MAKMTRHAIVFLTHIVSKRILLHFKRLQEETNGSLFSLLCIHNSQLSMGSRVERGISSFRLPTPSLDVDAQSGARLLPNRHAQMRRLGRWYNKGFPDLAYLPAMMSEKMRQYEFIWLVENDVDYAGDWLKFFSSTLENDADLLTTYAYSRAENTNWDHWSWFEPPPEVSLDKQISSFNPIARFSKRMILAYFQAVESDGWQGHTEALWPTIALHNGLTVCDLGGNGPFCPAQWRDTHYYNPVVDGWDKYAPGRGDMPHSPRPFWLLDSKERGASRTDCDASEINKVTFICYPTVQKRFFHEDPSRYLLRDVLYHPVKIDPSRLRRYYKRLNPMFGRMASISK
jgi:hypothetical protein